ncbi:MAG TPA: hypothetical protein VGL80_05420 [Pseudonocardiaceae bacterium]|jgi:hypothetical protein
MTPDDELMAALSRSASLADPVPAAVDESARAALATRRLDEELARLLLDSALVGADSVRADGSEIRLLSFETDGVTLELQVEQDGTFVRGLAIGTAGPAVVETPDETRSVRIDDAGSFTVAGLPGGPTRIRVTAADGGGPVGTGWLRL